MFQTFDRYLIYAMFRLTLLVLGTMAIGFFSNGRDPWLKPLGAAIVFYGLYLLFMNWSENRRPHREEPGSNEKRPADDGSLDTDP
ncbi:MAG TPA: hypothetical protein VEI97_14335 [bacterium]|nr:hypothetical protein [bacterium]